MVEAIEVNDELLSIEALIDEYGLNVEQPYSDDDLAAITEAINEANAENHLLTDLLTATVLTTLVIRNRPIGVLFIERRLQYSQNDRAIAERRMLQRIRAQQQRSSRILEQHSQDLINGNISVQQWQRRVANHVRNDHLRMMQLGAGTRARVNRRHLERLQKRLWGNEFSGELGSLSRLSERLQAGEISQKMLLYRSRMFALNTRVSYEEARQVNFIDREWVGRRTLDPSSDHCPDCPAYQRLSWVPASEIVPVGAECRCGGRCRCRTEYRRVNLSDVLPIQ